jgi:hypothetical protein
MTGFEHALLLILLLAGLSVAGRWLPWPMPITHVLGATVAAWWLGFPRLALDPGFFFLCFLPPLLFADGWLMPLREFGAPSRAILTLAIGLVIFTTLAVGFVAHWLVPGLPLTMAFALGAIVSPTDAVAVNAITERLRVPARLTTVLNGESLMNDATGLVAFKFALAAVIAGGGFSLGRATASFALISVVGFAIGLAIGYGIGRLRDLLQRLSHVRTPHRDHALPPHTVCRLPRRRILRRFRCARRRRRRPLLGLARSRAHGRANPPDRLRRLGHFALLAQRHRLRPPRPAIPRAPRRCQRLLPHHRARRLHHRHRRHRHARAFCVGLRRAPTCPLCCSSASSAGKSHLRGRPSRLPVGPACAAPSPSPPPFPFRN